MKKDLSKYKIKPIDSTDEDVRNAIRNLEEVLGEKVDFSVSSGKKEKIKYHFSSDNPEIQIGNKKAPLKVEFSSTQQDNDKLLHFLFDKTRQ
ncbi:MAG: hypothetical protein WC120_04710 [Parcubacteria group bacterium]